MKYAIAGTAAAVILAGGATVLLSHPGNAASPAACSTAMASTYLSTLRNPDQPPAVEPPSCHGVPTSVVSGYAAQIMGGH